MARPKSEGRRKAILDGACRTIAADGLSAPTALIAREAGISTGSLFTYFATKADLLNQLYVELTVETASAALQGLPRTAGLRRRTEHMWSGWLHWAAANPGKRRALAHLKLSDEITEESRLSGRRAMLGVAGLIEESRANGPMRDVQPALVIGFLNAMAETTVDFMIAEPTAADAHAAASFEAAWRMLS